jgi:predicted membrane-bound spermidine synthase
LAARPSSGPSDPGGGRCRLPTATGSWLLQSERRLGSCRYAALFARTPEEDRLTAATRRLGRRLDAATRVEKEDLRPLRFPGTFAFIGSGCLLVLEIDAGRILAPAIGISLYTWTSVIGVVLAGISLGNWLGGRLADRRPGRSILSYEYLAGGIASGLILIISRDLARIDAPSGWPADLQVLWLAVALVFLPSLVLGMVTPMIVKLSLSSLGETGRVVGRIQAAASLGSICGVFLAGFFLISAFGTRAIVADVTVLLLVLAVASNPFWVDLPPRAARAAAWVGGAAVVTTLVASFLTMTYDQDCTRESDYYCIRVSADDTGDYKQLSLDLLIHGIVNPKNPAQLVYPYERLYGQVVDGKYKDRDRPVSAFAIGGGTYTFPQWLEKNHSGTTLVAEIDKEVTEVAREDLGFRESPGIRIIHSDARPVLRDRPDGERYDLVLGDAFGDIAIPYHLVTQEFNEIVKDHLKPDGLYLVNVVDGVDYDFLRSYVKTLMKTFPQVRLIVEPGGAQGEQNTFVIAAGNQPPPQTPTMATPAQLGQFLNEGDSTILTDDHVPVDQLLAPVFRQRMHTHVEDADAGGA